MALTPRRSPDHVVRIYNLTLEMWAIGETWEGRDRYAYRFYDTGWSDEPVFEGADFSSHGDWDEAAAGLLRFLTLKEGDTDDEYFEKYTPQQLDWRDSRAEEASLLASDFEESLQRKKKDPKEWRP